MRPVLRILLAAAAVALPLGAAQVNCGTDAQNIEACREIESARCDLAAACTPGFDVASCKRFYRDACLVGTAQPDAGDSALIQPCITALQACGTAAGSTDPTGCPGQMLRAGAQCQRLEPLALDGGLLPAPVEPTACNIILYCPEVLEACAWVTPPDAGADAASDGSDGSDAAVDAGTGGTGGSGTGGSGGG